jgi:hypothetical protein
LLNSAENQRRRERGERTALELFTGGIRQMEDQGSGLAGRWDIKSQLSFSLQPLGEDQSLTVRIPNHELSLAVWLESVWLEWFASIRSTVDPF